jgi:anti-sigma B factor antagonist
MAPQLEHPPRKDDPAAEVIVVHFAGSDVSLDEGTLQQIRAPLLALADEPGASALLLDFGNVQVLTSAALGTLVSLHKKLRGSGRHMTVGNLSPQLHEVFAVTRLDRLLDLRRTGQEGGPAVFPTGVLVVDDETAVRYVLAARLRLEGYKLWSAGHGPEAVELYQRHREEIAVVLLDVLMPGMDGPHTLAVLQKLCPAVCCCFMTGNPTPYTEEALLRMGAIRIFQKPFVFTEVVGTLNQLTSQSPAYGKHRWIGAPWKGV